MRRFFLAAACLLAFGFQQSDVDFSGTWRLDIKMSKGLAQAFKNVRWETMTVRQEGDSMVVTKELEGSGQSVTFPPTIYKFDGSEVYREDTLRGTKRWIRAQWTTTGKKLIITNRVEQKGEEGELKYTQTDVWQFGKKNMLMLLMTKKSETADSTQVERRYYRRVR